MPRNDAEYWELRINRDLVQQASDKAPDYVHVSVFKRRLQQMDRYLTAYRDAHGLGEQP
jgi:hypothetical protein